MQAEKLVLNRKIVYNYSNPFSVIVVLALMHFISPNNFYITNQTFISPIRLLYRQSNFYITNQNFITNQNIFRAVCCSQ